MAEKSNRKSQTPGDATKDTAAGESGGQFPSDMSEMKLVSRPESSLKWAKEDRDLNHMYVVQFRKHKLPRREIGNWPCKSTKSIRQFNDLEYRTIGDIDPKIPLKSLKPTEASSRFFSSIATLQSYLDLSLIFRLFRFSRLTLFLCHFALILNS